MVFLRRHLYLVLWLIAPLLVLGACAYRGDIDQPVTIKATWFSYLNGDDIRAACQGGAPDRFRLIYNGNYEEQLRSYEVTSLGGGGAGYKARVMDGSGLDLTHFSLSDPQSMARWTTSQARLDPEELAGLDGALAASGAFGASPQGLRLASEQFYWVMSACRGGVFYFNAWLYPSPRFDQLVFADVLLRYDRTGIALNPLREVSGAVRFRRNAPGEERSSHFDVQVGDGGLQGMMTLF
jgi:hypothetical protein